MMSIIFCMIFELMKCYFLVIGYSAKMKMTKIFKNEIKNNKYQMKIVKNNFKTVALILLLHLHFHWPAIDEA